MFLLKNNPLLNKSNTEMSVVPKKLKLVRKLSILLIIILFASIGSFGQTANITGNVTDGNEKKSIESATIILKNLKDSSFKKTTLSDNKGNFIFSNLPTGNYLITATAIGYSEYTQMISAEDNNANSISLAMEKKGNVLSGITIVATGPAVAQKGDTSQYNANQYKVNPDATTEDLVKKMPGITVDKQGTITAHGEQVKKVTVDGKDFFGDDAISALKNMPANAVDKIQVYDRVSDQAQMTGIDDGNTQKSINIITKAGINNAQFGRIYAGVGTENTYSAGGNASFFHNDRRVSIVGGFNNINEQNFGTQDLLGVMGNSSSGFSPSAPKGLANPGGWRPPGGPAETFTVNQSNGISTTNALGINYGDKWGKSTTVSGSYFFNNSKNNNSASSHNNIFEENQTTFTESETNSNNFNHRINARIEYKADSNNMFFLIPSINFQNNNFGSFSTLNSYKNNADSVFNSRANSLADRSGYNIKNNLMYRHSFHKKGRIFSIGLNTTFTKNDGNATIDGIYRFYDELNFPVYPDSLQQQNSVTKSDGYTLNSNITYNEPLDKKGLSQLQIEYNPTIQKNHADQQTLSYDGQSYSRIDSTLTNKFDNTLVTHNGGLTYRFTPNKDQQLSVSVNYQQSELESNSIFPGNLSLKQHFQNLLPGAFWRKKFNNYSNIRAFYRASTNLPTVMQLQDVVNLSNPLNVSVGNPDLKQSYSHFVGSRYSYSNTKTNRNFFIGAFFQTSRDYIANATFIAAADSVINQGNILRAGSQMVKPVNLDSYRLLRSYANFSMPVKRIKTTINFNTGFLYNRQPGAVNYIPTVTNTFQYVAGISFVSNVSEYVDFNISYNANINNAQTKGTFTTSNNYVNHTTSVVFNLLSKKGWFLQNDLTYQIYDGLTGGFNQNFCLWNAAIGKKFFKNKSGELKISVFDILKQNQSISRLVTNTYLEDSRNLVLQQYFMMTFSYSLKNFGTPKKNSGPDEFLPKVGYPNP